MINPPCTCAQPDNSSHSCMSVLHMSVIYVGEDHKIHTIVWIFTLRACARGKVIGSVIVIVIVVVVSTKIAKSQKLGV